MSFILDALKKVGQKQKKGSVPDLGTVHEPLLRDAERRPIWPYLVVTALLLNAATLLVLLKPWGTDDMTALYEDEPVLQRSRAPNEEQKMPPEAEDTVVPPDKTPGESMQAVIVDQVSGPVSGQNEPEQEGFSGGSTSENIHAPPVPGQDIAPLTADEEQSLQGRDLRFEETGDPTQPERDTAPEETPGTAAGVQTVGISKLPESIQSDLKKIKIKGHIYSNSPSARLVNINGLIVREGEKVTDDLSVIEITPSGVIFKHGVHRFTMRAF